jgi:hypothetical protein
MITTSNSSFYEEERNAPDQLRILTIRLLFADPPGANVGRVPNPQLKLQLGQESFEPARVPARFHSDPHLLPRQSAVELFRLFAMR